MDKRLYTAYQMLCGAAIRSMAAAGLCLRKIDRDWAPGLRQMAAEAPSIHTVKMLSAFFSQRIQLLQKAESRDDRETVSVICVEKDSLVYMKKLLPYYRQLGVRHFIMIDDHSSDGTREYLRQQPDVTLYAAPCPYENHKASGWVLQAIRDCGSDRWYLRADADEFLSWQGMEGETIYDLLRAMERSGMNTIRAVMLDMYPAYGIFDGSHEDESFLEDYLYFDDASSFCEETEKGEIFGGMRSRTTGARLRMDKYVLFRPDRGGLPVKSHYVTGPHSTQERTVHAVLRHYKFLPSQAEKYRRIIAEKGKGYASFREVKKYETILDGRSLLETGRSLRWESSQSLAMLELVRPLPKAGTAAPEQP